MSCSLQFYCGHFSSEVTWWGTDGEGLVEVDVVDGAWQGAFLL